MNQFDDLQLNKWSPPPEPQGGRVGWRIAAAVAVLLGLAAAAYFLLWRRDTAESQDVKVHTEQAVAESSPAKPVGEPGQAIDLPPIEQTDPLVRELVSSLSTHPTVMAWLATDQLVRNVTAAVLNISNGRSPSRQLQRVRPREGFHVLTRGSTVVIDPRSYRRYDGFADAAAALDARGTAQLYATLKPRFQDGYRELGFPEGDFDRVLERAIGELLETPVVEGDVVLVSNSVAYDYADPQLQSLSAAQRQFLRMGPRNVRLIQAKLREIAPLAGLSVGPQH
jgi:hypothetical protein